jgi:hypothetical protein
MTTPVGAITNKEEAYGKEKESDLEEIEEARRSQAARREEVSLPATDEFPSAWLLPKLQAICEARSCTPACF